MNKIKSFFNPKSDSSILESGFFFIIWLMMMFCISQILQNPDKEGIINNKFVQIITGLITDCIPMMGHYLELVKTDINHSKILITIGLLGFIPAILIYIRNRKFYILKPYNRFHGRSKNSELFMLGLSLVFIIGMLLGYYPTAILKNFGLRPSTSLFQQGLCALFVALAVYFIIELALNYICRNKYEKETGYVSN